MGAVLFLAEQRMSRSIDNLVSSSSVLKLVNMVETRVTKLTTISNNFGLNQHTKFAKSYARDLESHSVSLVAFTEHTCGS